jgi:hypothetical protein
MDGGVAVGVPTTPPTGWSHAVHLYETDGELIDGLATYLASGWSEDAVGLVIATPRHRLALDQRLAACGFASASEDGRLVALDAVETLSLFMRDGTPDPGRFEESVGSLVRGYAERQPVRAFGEMVDVLWAEGNVVGALRLEELWGDLQRTVPFSLLCAYASDHLLDADGRAEVCTAHDRVFA